MILLRSRFDGLVCGIGSNKCAALRSSAAFWRAATLVGLAIHGLRKGSRAAHIVHDEHLDLEVAGIVGDLQTIADMHLASCFGGMTVGLDAAQLAGFL